MQSVGSRRVQGSADERRRARTSTGRCRCWKAAKNCKYRNFIGQGKSKQITVLEAPHIRPCIHFKGCGMAGGNGGLAICGKDFEDFEDLAGDAATTRRTPRGSLPN